MFDSSRSIKSRKSTKISKYKKAHNLSVSSPDHDLFVTIFIGHYKLTLGGVFREREKSASYASYCRSKVSVLKTLSNLVLAIFLKETQDLML